MGFDPMTMAAMASTASSVAGQKQVAHAQPFIPPNTGGGNPMTGQSFTRGTSGVVNQAAEQALPLIPRLALGGMDSETSTSPPAPPGSEVVDGSTKVPGQDVGFFDSFFGSLDQNIGDPGKLLTLGLLNQLGGNTRIGTMGLLGKGLYDAFTRNR